MVSKPLPISASAADAPGTFLAKQRNDLMSVLSQDHQLTWFFRDAEVQVISQVFRSRVPHLWCHDRADGVTDDQVMTNC